MASGLIIKSLIHFELIFVNGVRVFQFHSSVCNCPAFPTPFLKRQAFSDGIISTFLVINLLTIYIWGYFWDLYSVSVISVSIFIPIPYCLINTAL